MRYKRWWYLDSSAFECKGFSLDFWWDKVLCVEERYHLDTLKPIMACVKIEFLVLNLLFQYTILSLIGTFFYKLFFFYSNLPHELWQIKSWRVISTPTGFEYKSVAATRCCVFWIGYLTGKKSFSRIGFLWPLKGDEAAIGFYKPTLPFLFYIFYVVLLSTTTWTVADSYLSHGLVYAPVKTYRLQKCYFLIKVVKHLGAIGGIYFTSDRLV